MPNEVWMYPALQKSEAVLLPAMEQAPGGFQPVDFDQAADQDPGSTVARPVRRSMAGRAVLHSAGIQLNPYARRKGLSGLAGSRPLLRAARRRLR